MRPVWGLKCRTYEGHLPPRAVGPRDAYVAAVLSSLQSQAICHNSHVDHTQLEGCLGTHTQVHVSKLPRHLHDLTMRPPVPHPHEINRRDRRPTGMDRQRRPTSIGRHRPWRSFYDPPRSKHPLQPLSDRWVVQHGSELFDISAKRELEKSLPDLWVWSLIAS